MGPLPPTSSQTPPILPIINTNPNQSRAAFGRWSSCTPHQHTDNSVGHISAVSINGHSYNGSIFYNTEPKSPEGYISYDALFITWMTGYLHNYIGCFPHQHGYIILKITSNISKAVTNSNAGTFFHPVLSDTEHVEGYKFDTDSWADTCCAGKHAFVEEFIEGKTVTATGFTSSLVSV